MNRDTFGGAVHGLGKRVAVSRTFDMADHGATGAGRARSREAGADAARPVTGAVHAGSSRRDSFAGAAAAGRSRTHDSAERWRAACRGSSTTARSAGVASSNPWTTTLPRFPTIGRTYRPGFQGLEAGTDTLNRRSGSLIVALEPGSDIEEEPRPFHFSGDFAALRVSGGGVRDDGPRFRELDLQDRDRPVSPP